MDADGPRLLLGHTATGVTDTLGPGRRSVVWVQGCHIGCPGCIVPESWGVRSGTWVDPAVLADDLLGSDSGHLTVSGGEPTEQAAAVTVLLRAARALGRTTWVYTGRRLEDLVEEADEGILTMLTEVDVLVDGPFVGRLAGGVGYRGSRNQRIIRLTDAVTEAEANGGAPGKVELRLDGEDGLVLIGVPEPGFLPRITEKLAERGVTLESRHWR
ncbi:4Fe-4S single cluster domain-containing protein [Microbacterium lacticum]